MPGWWYYLTGYLILRVSCSSPEEFLNLAWARGFYFWDVRREGPSGLVLKIRAGDFRSLRPVVREAGARVKIMHKVGLPFWKQQLRSRPGLAAGVLAFVVAVSLFLSFIWSVEVRSPEELRYITEDEVRDWVAEQGLRPGTWRGNIDANALAADLVAAHQELAWAGIYLEGTRAVVEVVERRFPGSYGFRGPSHLVAARDALVEEVVVIDGQARVKPGDTVRQGEVLISGIVLSPESGRPRLVRARGQVKGLVWYEAVGEALLFEEKKVPTGRQVTALAWRVGDRTFWLKKSPAPGSARYVVERRVTRFGGMELVAEKWQEVEIQQVYRDRETALRLAYQRAIAALAPRLPSGVSLQSDYQMQVLTSTPRQVRVKVTAQVSEKIGMLYPLQTSTSGIEAGIENEYN